MKIQILRSAMQDLAVGRKFYDRQEAGIGDYFFDSLFADIDSLALYAGIHSFSPFWFSPPSSQTFSLCCVLQNS
jgi:hypothetical protein